MKKIIIGIITFLILGVSQSFAFTNYTYTQYGAFKTFHLPSDSVNTEGLILSLDSTAYTGGTGNCPLYIAKNDGTVLKTMPSGVSGGDCSNLNGIPSIAVIKISDGEYIIYYSGGGRGNMRYYNALNNTEIFLGTANVYEESTGGTGEFGVDGNIFYGNLRSKTTSNATFFRFDLSTKTRTHWQWYEGIPSWYDSSKVLYRVDLTPTYFNLENNEYYTGLDVKDNYYNASSVPAGAYCEDINIPNIINQRLYLSGSLNIEQTDTSILLSDGITDFSTHNGKSFSGQLYKPFNGEGAFEFDGPYFTFDQLNYFTVKNSQGMDYFNLDVTGKFYPLQTSDFDNAYSVNPCGESDLLNPEMKDYLDIGNQADIHFQMGKEYSLGKKYNCLRFRMWGHNFSKLTLNDFTIGRKIQDGFNTSQLCYTDTEQFIDGESYTGSLDDLGDTSIKVNYQTTLADILGTEKTINNELYDKDGDGVIGLSESSEGIFGWLVEVKNSISKLFKSVVEFFQALQGLGDSVEHKDLMSWLIPQSHASSGELVDTFFSDMNENTFNDNKLFKNFFELMVTLMLFALFLIIFGVLYMVRKT